MKQALLATVLALVAIGVAVAASSGAAASMPPPQMRLLVFTEECHDKFFVQRELNVECLKKAVSKTLGYVIVYLSPLVKVPQIIKIKMAGNAVGISEASHFVALTCATLNGTYNLRNGYPFSAWGEALFLGVQDVFVILLIWWYGRPSARKVVGVAAAFMTMAAVLSAMPFEQLVMLPFALAVLGNIGKLPQIVQNYTAGHTGQLSVIMYFMLGAGGWARAISAFVETGDKLSLTNTSISGSLASAVFLQILFYWRVTKREMEALDKKKKGE
eukprot:NODE_14745_length_1089_cov_4.976091.p1 GENE.NODE_14745_length_1089_cov_4.976091~~NODE_14745_length_1089_cov_4.976091.p1  ORF type:complete len:272 (-),score=91.00 NODE_14745_length_1089_cov_4.976091:191-1006(-)